MEYSLLFDNTVAASRALNLIDEATKNNLLMAVASAAENATETILAANAKDLAKMDVANPKYDRLKLTVTDCAIAEDIRQVAPTPLTTTTHLSTTIPNGMILTKYPFLLA